MPALTDPVRILARATAAPDLAALRAELSSVLSQAGGIRDRQATAQNIRLCRWDGQSDDYRRHEDDIGEPATPFEGAPDQRVPAVDLVIRERVALLVQALFDGQIQAKPLKGILEAEDAVKTSRILAYLRENVLDEELRHEAELLANYQEGDEPGCGYVKVWWHREFGLELRTLSLDEVGQLLLKAQGIELPTGPDGAPAMPPPRLQAAIDDVGDAIYNEAREDEALDLMEAAFPSVRRTRLRRCLKELRKTQSTSLPLPYVKANRPCVAACRYMEDIFFPSDLDNLQKARVIFEREWLTEVELRERVHSQNYDSDWVDSVIDRGPGGGETDGFRLDSPWTRDLVGTTGGDRETDKKYEIWHAYTKAADEYGIPGVYWTVFSDKVKGLAGYHELLDYPDGEYPFIAFRAEIVARGVSNSRGVAERGGSMQNDIKLQRDARGAHTMLATVPPVRVAQRRGGLEVLLGPMVEVPVRQPDDVTWMNPPQFPSASIEMEKSVWNDLNQYFGRIMPGVPPEMAQALLKMDVNRWLGKWKRVWEKILQLQQDFGDPVEMQLVTGGPLIKYSKEEIRGEYAVSLTFSVRDLSPDFVLARNNAIAAVLTQDTSGLVDRTVIVKAGLRAIDPTLADQALRDPQVVTQKEVEDERGAVNMMASGLQPALRQTGINAQLRLTTLQQTVQQSPVLLRRYLQPQTPDDEYFKQLVDERQKNLSFLVEQHTQNPAIGLQGAAALQPVAGVARTPAE